ncbi:MAG: hypothetical protein ACRDRA_20740 [Pseudonocardiaceae bacterium]
MSSVADCLDHAVTPEAMNAARSTGGRPVAACGARLLVAALCAPPQRRCPGCLDVELPMQRQADSGRRGRHARLTVWRRFRDRTRHS